MKLPRTFFLLIGSLGGAAALHAQEARSPERVSREINDELPRWLHFSGEERVRTEHITGEGFKSIADLYLLNRFRLNMDVRPVAWLKFSFQAEDSRVFGQNILPAPASQKNAIDLRVGYTQLGAEEGAIVLRAGRQSLDFGDGRLLADPNWSNVGRTFDGVRLTVRHSWMKVDLFSTTAVKIDPLGFDQPTPAQHFDGAYGSLTGLVPGARVEPYILWHMEHGCRNEGGKNGNLDEKTVGFRWAGKLPGNFDYTNEMALQAGSWAGDRVRSWMAHWVAGHTFSNLPWTPRTYLEYNRASGNSDPRDGVHNTFDPLFAATHDKYGLLDLFGSSNIVHFRGGVEWRFIPSLTLGVAYNNFSLATSRDGLYSGGKILVSNGIGSSETHIGQDADLQATWNPRRITTVNLGYGHLFPGAFLRRNTSGASYSLLFAGISQRFQ